MTVEQTATYVRSAGNGVTTVFNFPFRIFDVSDITVSDIDESIPYASPTVLGNPADYSVTISSSGEGGSITLAVPLASGHSVDIRSAVEFTQPTDIRNQGRFFPDIHEGVFDRLVRQVQTLSRKATASLRYPDDGVTNTDAVAPSVTSRAGRYLSANAITGAFEWVVDLAPTVLGQSLFNQFLTDALQFFYSIFNPRTDAEIAAGVTPVNFKIPSHDFVGAVIVDRYGTNTVQGTTDMTAAILAAIAVCPEGGTVQFLDSTYKYSSLGAVTKAITLRGAGFFGTPNNAFGNVAWNSGISGSVLRATATSGTTIAFGDSVFVKRFCLENLAIIGPGTGTSVGVSLATSAIATVQNQWRGVLIANFATGVKIINTYESDFYGLNIRGCGIGFDAPHDSGGGLFSENHFYRCEFQTCTTGVRLQLSSGISFHGCLWQNDTTALLLQPQAAGGVSTLLVEGYSWFENIGGTDINIDSTNGALKHLTFRGLRFSTGAITFTGANIVNYLHFENISGSGIALTLPVTAQNVTMVNAEFLSITDNSQFKLLRFDDTYKRHFSGSATVDPSSLADGVGQTFDVTVTGASVGDFAIASFSNVIQDITVTAWVNSTNAVKVRFQNESGGTLDLASGTLRVRVFQQ